MYRQWDRTITDQLLYRVLPLLKETKPNKSILFWVDLQQLKEPPPSQKQYLGLVIKNDLLISCFWRQEKQINVSNCAKRKYPTKPATRFSHA